MNLCTTTALCVAFSMLSGTSHAISDDEAKIETLENSFIAAFNAKDVDAIMKCYMSGASLVVFDQGLAGLSAILRGPSKVWITDLHVEAAGDFGYGLCLRKSKVADVIPRIG